ncbi:MAG: hypothetical protein ACK8QZ_02375 [Anaerolineales bacterium]
MTYTQTRWSLDDLFPSLQSPQLEAAFQEMEERLSRFERARSELSPQISEAAFLDLLRQYEAITTLGNRLHAMAGLSFAADTQDTATQTLLGRVHQFMAEAENRTLFFTLWWKGLDEATATRLMAIKR